MADTDKTQAPTTETKPEETSTKNITETVTDAATAAKDNVFSMFGGGAKKENTKPDEDDNDRSGSAKAQKEKADAEGGEDDDKAEEEEADVEFTPVVHLTEKVDTKTNEELEEQTFKMRAKLFKFDRESRDWKERGTGDVRLLKHRENGKTRLVMRRDKTLKVCANHYVVPDMKLSPNVGSDRSWVWNAAADVSEGEAEACTLAIRFANSESRVKIFIRWAMNYIADANDKICNYDPSVHIRWSTTIPPCHPPLAHNHAPLIATNTSLRVAAIAKSQHTSVAVHLQAHIEARARSRQASSRVSSWTGKRSNMPDVKRTVKLITQQRVNDDPPEAEGFPMRSWDISVYLIDTTSGDDIPANCFEKVTYVLHESFGKRARQAFKNPPFTIKEKGWGEFDMSILLTPVGAPKGGEIQIQHDLNFQQERYESTHSVSFRNPKAELLERLKESGTIGETANGAPKSDKKRQKTSRNVDMEKLAEALPLLGEDDLLQVVQMVHDNKNDDTYTKNDVENGEFHVDLYTLPDALIKMLWDFCEKRVDMNSLS
nr:ran-specific gtpase-activating protein 1 [Quercus suber]